MKLISKAFPIPDLRFILKASGLWLPLCWFFIRYQNAIIPPMHVPIECRAAQHLERVTQQSAHTDTGVAAWLIKNPSVNFRSNYNVLALLPV